MASGEVSVAPTLATIAVGVLGAYLLFGRRKRSGDRPRMKTVAPYGSWRSPIQASTLTAKGSVKLLPHDLQCDEEGKSLFWLEERPQEGGRSVIRSHRLRSCLEGTQEDETPEGYNSRTMVHEYGGGVFRCFDGSLIFSNFEDQALYMTLPESEVGGKEIMQLTASERPHRFADGDVDTSRARRSHLGSWVNATYVCVREDHTKPAPADVRNEVVAVNLTTATGGAAAMGAEGEEERSVFSVLAAGRDFYASPKVSPDGRWLAFVCWDHPSMPWDDTELWLMALDPATGMPLRSWCLVGSRGDGGGGGGGVSVQQPVWAADGSALYFASDHLDRAAFPASDLSTSTALPRYYNVYRLATSDFSQCGVRHPAAAGTSVGADARVATTTSTRGKGEAALIETFPEKFINVFPVEADCAGAPWQLAKKTFDVGAGGWCVLKFEELPEEQARHGKASSTTATTISARTKLLLVKHQAVPLAGRGSEQEIKGVLWERQIVDVGAAGTLAAGSDPLPPHILCVCSDPVTPGALYFIGGGPDIPTGIFAVRPVTATNGAPSDKGGVVGSASSAPAFQKAGGLVCRQLYSSLSSATDIPTAVATATTTATATTDLLSVLRPHVSHPRRIAFPTAAGETAFAYFYPPLSADFCAPAPPPVAAASDASVTPPPPPLPPCLVKAHGGPTSSTSSVWRLDIQFWTSRGFAVLDVDYRGSAGYGRGYRQSLTERSGWGVMDVEDVLHGARHAAREGLVDPERLCIDGGSAGGYTTLAALTAPDTCFKAGCSKYGIGDVTMLAQETHKFESRYCDRLIGPYPEAAHVYEERSPVNHTDRLSCPVLLLQGADDKVVPPDQAESMFRVMRQKGLPCAYLLFPGEGHGFRKAENIEKALNAELFFYSRVFGFECPDCEGGEVEIFNLNST